MSFLHPALLGLLALAAVPVILHFLMRPKPKRMIFPALRLIASRRKSNTRRLKLRHIWLLILRILVIGLLVFALARPLVPAANWGFSTVEWFTLGAVLAACAFGYFAAVRWWGRRAAARHEFLYRRSVARGGSGVAAALLVLLLVLWPYARRVAAEVADPTQSVAEDRPVAAIFLFDTSPSMGYQFEGTTRLAAAQRLASDYLETLPPGSRVAVADLSEDNRIVFAADLVGAKARIERLATAPGGLSIDDRLRAAFEAEQQDRDTGLSDQASVPEPLRRDNYVRAVYVFTDLAASAWNDPPSRAVRERLDVQKWLQLYLLDVGVAAPINIGLTAVRPSEEIATAGRPIRVAAEVSATGGEPRLATIELYVETDAGLVKQGQAETQLRSGGTARVEFPLPVLRPPLLRGELRLTQADPLAADDVRFFTVAAQTPPKVLIVSDRPADAFLWSQALAPSLLTAPPYSVTRLPSARLATAKLDDFDAIYLLNVTAPSPAAWESLGKFVLGGGGLGVILGTRVDSSRYNAELPQTLLPGKLLTQLAFNPPEFFTPSDDAHPIFARFDDLGGYGDLTRRDVRRHWIVEPNAGASVVAAYTYAAAMRPALLVRPAGAGRVALLTTGVDAGGWSDLPNARWPFVALADQLTQFLSGRSGGRRVFDAGATVVLNLPRGNLPPKLLLRTPDLNQRSLSVPADGRLNVPNATALGQYEIAAPPGGPAFETGFSINLPAAESDFTRLETADLDARFGEDRYRIATDPTGLAVVVRDTTLGAELVPYLLMLFVAVYCGEQFVANRFYEGESTAV